MRCRVGLRREGDRVRERDVAADVTEAAVYGNLNSDVFGRCAVVSVEGLAECLW